MNGTSHQYLRPFLGLTSVADLLQNLRDSNCRIDFLRRTASRVAGLEDHECIIQYTEPVQGREILEFYVNYASAFRQLPESAGEAPSQQQPAAKRLVGSHSRWLHPEVMNTTSAPEALHENNGYSTYTPTSLPRLTCSHNRRQGENVVLDCWYGDWHNAAIYACWNPRLPRPSLPKITQEDLLWCLEHDLLSLETFLSQANDTVTQTLECLAQANIGAFATIPGPVIQVQTLGHPLMNAGFTAEAQNHTSLKGQRQTSAAFGRTISILAYLVAGHDIPHYKIPGNIVGISSGDSVFVPEKVSPYTLT